VGQDILVGERMCLMLGITIIYGVIVSVLYPGGCCFIVSCNICGYEWSEIDCLYFYDGSAGCVVFTVT